MPSPLTYLGRPVSISRKKMKNIILRIGPGGLLKISCPRRTTNQEILSFLEKHRDWILRQPVPAKPEPYRDAGPVRVFDEELIIHALPGTGQTRRDGKQLRLFVKDPTDALQIEKKVRAYQREALKDYIAIRLPHWEAHSGLYAEEWGVRDMKTRWGSCHTGKKKLLFNLKLSEKPLICTDLVIMHELAHLEEHGHTPRFYAILDRFMPGWRATQALLDGVNP